MVTVAGLWELGWNTPIFEHDLWMFPLRDFCIDDWYMSPISGIKSDNVHEIPDLGEFLNEIRNSGRSIVFVDEGGETDLKDFNHPDDVVYVFGKAGMSSMRGYGRPGDVSLKITTCGNLGTLWPHQALGIVLYDRQMKSWQ